MLGLKVCGTRTKFIDRDLCMLDVYSRRVLQKCTLDACPRHVLQTCTLDVSPRCVLQTCTLDVCPRRVLQTHTLDVCFSCPWFTFQTRSSILLRLDSTPPSSVCPSSIVSHQVRPSLPWKDASQALFPSTAQHAWHLS